MLISPEAPERETPVDSRTDPLRLSDAPVEISVSPLDPADVAFPLDSFKVPLDVPVLAPLEMSTFPPLSDDDAVRPPCTLSSPPAPDELSPTLMVTSPPWPSSAEPDATVTEPD
jgi:hypothetical protein